MTSNHRNKNNEKNNDTEDYSLYGYGLQLLCPSPCPLLLFKLILLVFDLVLFLGIVLV